MAIGVYFAPPAMSAAQYNEIVKRLRKAGAGNPAGRSYHSSFGSPDKLMVFDVWTSQKAFDRFGKTLQPILKEFGLDANQPQIMPVHNVIVPSRKAAPARKTKKKAPAALRRRR